MVVFGSLLHLPNTVKPSLQMFCGSMIFTSSRESDSPITSVYVHYLPVEAGNTGIRLALAPFGKVLDITYQHFSGFKQILTGTRIVHVFGTSHHISM